MTIKTIKLFIIGTVFFCFIQACSDQPEAVAVQKDPKAMDTITTGCLVSYDINVSDNKEKINQVFGKDHIKSGHWITYGYLVTRTLENKSNRVKIEEGYYRNNKKVGFWKFYHENGILKDSVEYKDDVPVIKES